MSPENVTNHNVKFFTRIVFFRIPFLLKKVTLGRTSYIFNSNLTSWNVEEKKVEGLDFCNIFAWDPPKLRFNEFSLF